MAYQPFPPFADWRVTYDPGVVDRYALMLERARRAATPQQLDAALAEALRTAAVDTGALEGLYVTDRGFTRTVATQVAAWQSQAEARGPGVVRQIEAAIDGYEMVLDATTGTEPQVSQAWIRSLHATLTAGQDTYRVYVDAIACYQDQPLPRGVYKTMPNSPTNPATGEVHFYASPDDTPAEMARLTDQLTSPAFQQAHPVVQAAYAHFALVCVHPFADGNGRVARALASVYLYRNPGVPLVIFADQRNLYLDSLEAADAGRPDQFVNFIGERVIDTVAAVQQSIAAPSDDSATLQLAADRLLGLARARFDDCGRPDLAGITGVAAPAGAEAELVLYANGSEPFLAWQRELHPTLAQSLQQRLDTWVRNTDAKLVSPS